MPSFVSWRARCSEIAIALVSAVFASAILATGVSAQPTSKEYKPTWESLDSRPVPEWFTDARFGIFIHWGVYSVPSWAPEGEYAEWYWSSLQDEDGKTRAFHSRVYGENFKYKQFAFQFDAELFQPEQWAQLFKKAGARYVVLTTKHHDGYTLWPAPASENWNSVDVGPQRDLVGGLTEAVRNAGLRMGFYYSLHNWFNEYYAPGDPDGPRNIDKYVEEVMLPQMRDLVTEYEPSLLFADGEWLAPAEKWHTKRFLAWLYNESPAPEGVVVNDRWGENTRSRHGGYFTSEYGKVDTEGTSLAEGRPWEENRGIGGSFGFNRNEESEDYLSQSQAVHLLIDIVSQGGNLLLNVGPTHDGRIPAIMQDRLMAIGQWLDVNGEAIYGTEKWAVTGEGPTSREASIAQAESAEEAASYTAQDIRYTQSDEGKALYAITMGLPKKEVTLKSVSVEKSTDGRIELLGYDNSLPYDVNNQNQLVIALSDMPVGAYPSEHALAFKLTGFNAEPHPSAE